MVCESCRAGKHNCKGGTWCDCQHKEDLGLTPRPDEQGKAKRNESRD